MRGQPTPGEWCVKEIARGQSWDYAIESVVEDGTIWSVAKAVGVGERHGEAEANARFIVQACNSHDELLEAAKIALEAGAVSSRLDRLEYEALESAIAKAEGRE